MRHLLVERPHAAPYGQVSKCWDDITRLVNDEVDSYGNAVFDPSVKTQAIKDRFDKKYMPYAKKFQNGTPFRSGHDDEGPPTEIQQGIESLYEEWDACRKMSDSTKGQVALDKQKNKVASTAS